MEHTPPPASRSRGSAFPRAALILVTLAGAFVVLGGVRAGADIVAPLFLTLNLFIAAWPVKQALDDRGMPRIVGTIALCLVVFLVLALFFFALGWGVSALVRELPEYQSRFEALYADLVALLTSFGITQEQIVQQAQSISPANFTGIIQDALSGVSNFVSLMGVVVVMVFMMVMDSSTFPRRSTAVRRHQPAVALSVTDFILGVRRYWIVTTIFGLIVAVIDVGILLVAGVPLALVWGIVSFLTNYIPNVGFIIGIVPPVLMALLAQGPTAALWVAIGYCVANFVIQSIIQPKFNGDAVGVTASVSFLSLLLWGAVLGPLGALLALPATLLAKALLIDHDPQMRWLNAFLASDPDSADQVSVRATPSADDATRGDAAAKLTAQPENGAEIGPQ